MTKYKSIFICNYCGEYDKEVTKVMFSGLANILCPKCEGEFDEEIFQLAKKYLSEK